MFISSHSSAEWEIECVKCQSWYQDWFPNRCFWIMPEEDAWALATGGDRLRVYYKESGEWRSETIDDRRVRGVSMSVENLDRIHLSYFDLISFEYKYALKSGGLWTIETLGEDTAHYKSTSITHDSQGKPWIACYHSQRLHVMRKGETNEWIIEQVTYSALSGKYPSLVMDSQDIPHISYQSTGDSSIMYCTMAESSWQFHELWYCPIPCYSSIQLDDQNHPHIAFYMDEDEKSGNKGEGWLNYVYYDGSTWNMEWLDFFETSEISAYRPTVCLAFDSGGNPGIAYGRNADEDLVYASKSGGEWTFELIDGANDSYAYASLAYDDQDRPAVSFLSSYDSRLKTALKDQGEWNIESIDKHVIIYGLDFEIDSKDTLHICYIDNHSDLYYGRRESSEWEFELVTHYTPMTNRAQIELDELERPCIVYSISSGLLMARRTDEGWQLLPEYAVTGEPDRFTVRTHGDMFYIAYLDLPDLYFKKGDGETWGSVEEVTDNATNAVRQLSMCVQSSDRYYITYSQLNPAKLGVARYEDSAWTVDVVDEPNHVTGAYSSVEVNEEGDIFVAYSYFNTGLKLALYRDGVWDTAIVAEDTESMQDMELHPVNGPMIGYSFCDVRGMRFKWMASDAWYGPDILEEGFEIGPWNSLELDSYNDPHLIYRNKSQMDIKHAYKAPETPYPTRTPTVTNTPTATETMTITPTFTLSPTGTPSSTVTKTPTKTPTGQKTATPTATPTEPSPTVSPSPTTAPSPTPYEAAPEIIAAGWMDSYASGSEGGAVNITALTLGDQVEKVKLYYIDQHNFSFYYTGTDLAPVSGIDPPYAMFELSIENIAPGTEPGRYLLGLVAVDSLGRESDMWPCLRVEDEM